MYLFKIKKHSLLWGAKLFLTFAILLLAMPFVNAQTVDVWLTQGDQSIQLLQQPSLSFGNNGNNSNTITVNENNTFQNLDGFGFALTQGSAQALLSLNAATRSALLNELFNPTTGNAVSIVRISIAASDLSNSVYSYNEVAGDVSMNNFSLAGPDQTYLIPVLQEVLTINPNIKVLATPWTAPTWMKTNGAWIGGSLNPQFYAAYANYFIKYLDAMSALGINIWAITPQNEPENPFNEPSMLMNSTEQKNFINNHLGPAIANSNYSTKILAFDHNCDNTAFPIDVLNNSIYVDGAAFHLYAGDISAMSTVRNATNKNVYFTEQYTDINGNFDGDFGWHMENVVIGSLRNWSKTVIEWNLATDTNFGPRTPGGCTECLGAVTVNNNGTFTRNVSFYIISQISKFVQPNAQRIETNDNVGPIENVAFKNPDGSKVLLAYNKSSGSQSIKVVFNGQSFVYNIPARSAATFIWSGGSNAPINAFSTIQAESYSSESGTQVENTTDVGGGQNVGFIDHNEYIAFNNVDFGNGAASVEVRVAKNSSNTATIEFRLGSTQGQLIGSIAYGSTGGWQNWQTKTTCISGVSGIHNLFLVFKGGTSLTNINWLKFNSVSSTPINSGATYRLVNQASGKVLDVDGVSLANGARIQQWDWSGTGGDNQKWIVESVGNNEYTFKAVHSNKVMDVVNVSTADGAEIQQWDWAGGNNQKWRIEDVGGGYFNIIAVHSNKALAVPNSSTSNGTKLVQETRNCDADNQRWEFILLSSSLVFNPTIIKKSSSTQEKISIYPNPVQSEMQILLPESQPTQVKVLDRYGNTVLIQRLQAQHNQVYLPPTLQKGLYILQFTSQDGSVIQKKIMVE